jgi:hypothetical protein
MRWLSLPVRAPLRLLRGAPTEGESALFLARRTQPDPELAFPTHYRNRWRGIADRVGLDS